MFSAMKSSGAHSTAMIRVKVPIRVLIAAQTDAIDLTAAPVKGVMLLPGITAPVPEAKGPGARGIEGVVMVG